MNKEEINDAVANGEYIANIYGKGTLGYYKVYSMIDVISKLQEENEELKDKIREIIEKELPDDEIMKCCTIYDVNGIDLRKELEKIIKGD